MRRASGTTLTLSGTSSPPVDLCEMCYASLDPIRQSGMPARLSVRLASLVLTLRVLPIRFGQCWLTHNESVRQWPVDVRVYWGPTGSGKTRAAAAAEAERDDGAAYWWAGGRWWDGLDGHSMIIIDDFRPSDLKLHLLLKLLDRFPYRVEVKGGYRQMLARVIIITCPRHPRDWYVADDDQENGQLIRRIDEIREFVLENEPEL